MQGFEIYGDCVYTCNPCNLKSPHSDYHYNMCREFDFTGILWGFPALDVGKPCNNLIFGDILQGFPVNFLKLITCKVYIFFHCNIYMLLSKMRNYGDYGYTRNPHDDCMHVTGNTLQHRDSLHFLWGKHLQCSEINAKI